VDDGVGRVLDYLEKHQLADNTVVIYSADQGFYLGEHGWFDKRWIFEESIHMPFIIRWPGRVKPGSRPEAMIQNIDYAPTFVDIAGGAAPAGLHGRSFLPILQGETPADWRTSVYYRYYDPGHGVAQHNGVRTKDYTLAHYFETNEWDLFDLKKNPQQMQSVYADPAYAGVVQQLKAELERLRQQYGESDAMPYSHAKPAQKKNLQRKGKTKDGGAQ
jgi:N-acetylglucosamine-6-sulfatase